MATIRFPSGVLSRLQAFIVCADMGSIMTSLDSEQPFTKVSFKPIVTTGECPHECTVQLLSVWLFSFALSCTRPCVLKLRCPAVLHANAHVCDCVSAAAVHHVHRLRHRFAARRVDPGQKRIVHKDCPDQLSDRTVRGRPGLLRCVYAVCYAACCMLLDQIA